MELKKLDCPNCAATLDIKIDRNTPSIFCPYCGTQFYIDDDNRKTININKTIHTRHTDDAEVLKQKNAANEAANENKYLIAALILFVFLLVGPYFILNGVPAIIDKIETNKGRINIGYASDLRGQNYKTVVSQIKAAGFYNIELIDLDDTGVFFWEHEKVKSISIGGDSSFTSWDYFEKDAKVVISYH